MNHSKHSKNSIQRSEILSHTSNQRLRPVRRNRSYTTTRIIMNLLHQKTQSPPVLAHSERSQMSSTGGDAPEKSISEKVAAARLRNRQEATPVQRLFMRNNVRTVMDTTHHHTVLGSSRKGCSGPKERLSLDALPHVPINGWDYKADSTKDGTVNNGSTITDNEHSNGGNDMCSDGHCVDRPEVQRRADSTKTFRRGRSLFRSSAPKPRRHARPPFPTTSRIEEETAVAHPLRRLESLSPKPRHLKRKTNRFSRRGQEQDRPLLM